MKKIIIILVCIFCIVSIECMILYFRGVLYFNREPTDFSTYEEMVSYNQKYSEYESILKKIVPFAITNFIISMIFIKKELLKSEKNIFLISIILLTIPNILLFIECYIISLNNIVM